MKFAASPATYNAMQLISAVDARPASIICGSDTPSILRQARSSDVVLGVGEVPKLVDVDVVDGLLD